jgi:hypothetical protein
MGSLQPGWAKSPATNSVLQVNEPSCQQLNSASAGQTERTIKIKSQFYLNEIWGDVESIPVFAQDTRLVTESV